MPVEKIFIATHKGDLRLTRICVASIRYWYPDIPIYLIKDYFGGDFSTSGLERLWKVKVYDAERTKFGWGLSKLEPLFSERGARFLVLDSDIAFVGPVLDLLDKLEEDFVVQQETQPAKRVEEIYFSLDGLKRFDPDFRFRGYTFNTGQFVATGGMFRREDFDSLVNWEDSPPTLKHPNIFKNGDQGALNYVLMKKEQAGALSVARVPFMRWGEEEMSEFDLNKIASDSPYPYLIHWAGLKRTRLKEMLRSDILIFFEKYYYSRLRLGSFRRNTDIAAGHVGDLYRRAFKKVKSLQARVRPAGNSERPISA